MMNKALLTTAICFAACMPAWASGQDNATSSLKIQSAQDDYSDILNYGKERNQNPHANEPTEAEMDADALNYGKTKPGTPQSPLTGNASIDVKQETKPLDPLLCPGNYFDEKVATALLKDESANTSVWKKIPAWQAGDWESTQATNTKSIKYINGQQYAGTTIGVYTCKGEETIGWQKDRKGDVWHWYDSGYWTETEHDNYISHAFVKISMPGAYDYPDLYSESVSFSVDKSTGKIIDVQQRKNWLRYVSLAPELVKQESVHTVYDEKGQPTESAWNTGLKKRVKTFEQSQREVASNKEFSKLLHELFALYLKNNDLASLIPIKDDYSDILSTKPITNAKSAVKRVPNKLNTRSTKISSTR